MQPRGMPKRRRGCLRLGELRKGDRIQFSASGAKYEALEVGVLTPGVRAV